MPNAGSLKADSLRHFTLFIGKSGHGKKCAACSYPGPIKYFDFDGRIQGLIGADNWLDRSQVDYEYYPPKSETGVYERLNSELDNMYKLVQMKQYPFKTVVIASLTGISLSLLSDAIPLTHVAAGRGQAKKGKYLGPLAMAGPAEYGFQSQGIQNVLTFFRSIPLNVIFTAHMIDRWGKPEKPDGTEDTYAENVILGEKIAGTTDKLAEIVPAYFNEIYKFEKGMVGNMPKYYVTFRGDLPRTAFSNLPNGRVDITDKNFYQLLMEKASETKVA